MTGRIAAAVAAIASIAVAAGCGGESRAGDEAERAQAPARVFVLGYPKHVAGDVTRVGIYEVTLPGGQVQRVRLGAAGPRRLHEVHRRHGRPPGLPRPRRRDVLGARGAPHERPRRLGASWYFIPSSSPGRVWLTKLDTRSPATRRDLLGARGGERRRPGRQPRALQAAVRRTDDRRRSGANAALPGPRRADRVRPADRRDRRPTARPVPAGGRWRAGRLVRRAVPAPAGLRPRRRNAHRARSRRRMAMDRGLRRRLQRRRRAGSRSRSSATALPTTAGCRGRWRWWISAPALAT